MQKKPKNYHDRKREKMGIVDIKSLAHKMSIETGRILACPLKGCTYEGVDIDFLAVHIQEHHQKQLKTLLKVGFVYSPNEKQKVDEVETDTRQNN